MEAMTDEAEPKSKFAHLVKDADEDTEEGSSLDDMVADEDGGDQKPAEAKGGDYDLHACANDMMAAFQAGDVAALEEALGALLDKKK